MSTKRILAIIPNPEVGGAERATLDWIRWRGSEFEYVALVAGEGGVAAELRSMGVTVHLLPRWRQRNFWRYVPKVCSIVRRERIDLIHSCMQPAHLLGGAARLITGCPEVHFNHGPIGSQWIQGLSPWLPTDCLMVASEYMRKDQERFVYFAQYFAVVPLGLDCERLRPDESARRRVRERMGISDEEIVFVIAGRIARIKGQDLFLNALKSLDEQKKLPPWRVLIVGGCITPGEEIYAGNLRERAGAIFDSQRVLFTDHVDSVGPYYDAADLVVQATVIPETFGLVIAEAMLKEKLVIAARLGGPLEIIRHGENGLMFQAGDMASLASMLLKGVEILRGVSTAAPLLTTLRTITAAARQTVLEHNEMSRSTKQLEDIYRVVLGSRKNRLLPA
jgi:glycosyltransferase involved in cell wall biosynthesis